MPDRSAAVDEQAVLDELYGLRSDRFTAARTGHAARARQAGDRALAARITALRRPTLAAWASNQLVRAHPGQVEPILRLGEGLRRAHRELDGGRLRELTEQQRALVHALSVQARRLAAEAGQPLQEAAVQEVEQTLHAALADPDAAQQWAGGRLTRALAAAVDLTGATSRLTRPAGTEAPSPPARHRAGRRVGGAKSAVADQNRREREQRERQERITQARRQAETDAREAAARADDATTARQALYIAEADLTLAESDVERLTGELRRAEAVQRQARRGAGQRWQEADAVAQQARQRAADSAARAKEAGSS
ncbi:hypothetical protein [Actinacidiphila oryziradicis]|uniref:Uncharacterized protein n=1 Tax=Actinacidiphila oryziradicis TaxID=2571141 RepID=A0A4U0RKI3_9ACTN|nr:hypothetical protein [Actinacidiphila oryziradicis]TJZ96249.1 hypothetical protein FCI23_51305 [Actinacidiphila oryziradicis]